MQRIFGALILIAIGLVTPSVANAACPTLPYQLTNGQVADASQVMGDLNALLGCVNNVAPAGSTNSIQYNFGAGNFGGVTPLVDGQIVIGSTGNAPQTGSLTAGSGIAITNAPGSITISATGSAAVSPFYDPLSIPITRPSASSFVVNRSTGNTATLSDMVSRGVAFSVPNGLAAMEQAVPNSSAFTLTALVYPVGYLTGLWFWGLTVKDLSGKYAALGFRNPSSVAYFTFSSINSTNTFTSGTSTINAQNPVWVRLQLTGGNFIFTFSFDGEHFLPSWTVSATAYLNTSLSTVGFFVVNNNTGQNVILDVMSWTATTP